MNTGEWGLKPQYSKGANMEKFSLASSVWREPSGSREVLAGAAEYISPKAFQCAVKLGENFKFQNAIPKHGRSRDLKQIFCR